MRLRHPIVLVHGIAAKDGIKGFSFWGRIPDALRENGLEVHLGGTDAWGSIESNAALLGETIDGIVAAGASGKVNLIAHSKGGIDSRYLISTLGYSRRVASLTTICTPHGGSEIADAVVRRKSLRNPLARRALRKAGFLYGDRNPDPFEATLELTTASMREFNARNPDSPEVLYRNYYTRLRSPFDDPALFFSYLMLRRICGENDGVVSAVSCRRGGAELIEGPAGGISHAEIVDYKRTKISGLEIPEIYLGIARDLAALGL